MAGEILLSVAYLPPIQYFSKIATHDVTFIEQHENYIKQSYRNRCKIYSANGELTLSVPVKKSSSPKIPVREAEIDYATPWQKQHWKSIESAYRNSPFYEYFASDLAGFYEKKYHFLFDYDLLLIHKLLELLSLPAEIKLTVFYVSEEINEMLDMRDEIHPKKVSKEGVFTTYNQVFSMKYGFLPNLSILDLLFNEGPGAKDILEKH